VAQLSSMRRPLTVMVLLGAIAAFAIVLAAGDAHASPPIDVVATIEMPIETIDDIEPAAEASPAADALAATRAGSAIVAPRVADPTLAIAAPPPVPPPER